MPGWPWRGSCWRWWLVIDLDGTLITAHSDKEGAAPTFKMGYGFHPRAWCANTAESLAMLPRRATPDRTPSPITPRCWARRLPPGRMRSRRLVRVDEAGASHELITPSLASRCRTVPFSCGWAITEADEQAIGLLPAAAWKAAVDQDGVFAQRQARRRDPPTCSAGPPDGQPGCGGSCAGRNPPAGQAKNLTAFERATGWRYSIIVTNIPVRIGGVPSYRPQFIERVDREHAVVEDRVARTNKAIRLRNSPSKTWAVNCGWVLAANLAADLSAWCRLLGLYDQEDLKDAEPDTLRYRLWALPARLARHARARVLKISRTWPWKDAFLACWRRLSTLPAPT